MMGPPGTGKSMLAARFPGILPSMTEDEALESAAMQSLAAAVSMLPTGNVVLIGRPTIPPRALPWSVAAAIRVPAKFRWR